MFFKKGILIFSLILILTSCSEPIEKKRDLEEVSLNLFLQVGSTDMASFNDIPSRVRQKFPNVELTLHTVGVGGTVLQNHQDALNNNILPDIIMDYAWLIPEYIRAGYSFDHTGLARANNLDLSQFEPALLDHIRSWGDKDELYGIPYVSNLYALYYDKDYFDQMNVPYPKDGMTWDDSN